MKKFRFPLRSLATVRSMHELRAREQFSVTVRNYVAAEEHLKLLQARVAELEQILRSGRAQVFRPADEASFLAGYKEQTVAAAKAAEALKSARAAMEDARQAWLASRRDVRVVDNLEQKARHAHRREVEREDQAALDDRTSALAARATSSFL